MVLIVVIVFVISEGMVINSIVNSSNNQNRGSSSNSNCGSNSTCISDRNCTRNRNRSSNSFSGSRNNRVIPRVQCA